MEFLNTDGSNFGHSKLAVLHSKVDKDNVDDQDQIDAPPEVMDVVREQFDKLDRHED